MSAFENRFWGVPRLACSMLGAGSLQEQVEPLLNWRIMAIEDNAILLCKYPSTQKIQRDDLVIVEGLLMETWLEQMVENV